jgi:hypothetical protein
MRAEVIACPHFVTGHSTQKNIGTGQGASACPFQDRSRYWIATAMTVYGGMSTLAL